MYWCLHFGVMLQFGALTALITSARGGPGIGLFEAYTN